MVDLADRLARRVALLLPRRVVYWCVMWVWAYATTGQWRTDDMRAVTIKQAVDRWTEATW